MLQADAVTTAVRSRDVPSGPTAVTTISPPLSPLPAIAIDSSALVVPSAGLAIATAGAVTSTSKALVPLEPGATGPAALGPHAVRALQEVSRGDTEYRPSTTAAVSVCTSGSPAAAAAARTCTVTDALPAPGARPLNAGRRVFSASPSPGRVEMRRPAHPAR